MTVPCREVQCWLGFEPHQDPRRAMEGDRCPYVPCVLFLLTERAHACSFAFLDLRLVSVDADSCGNAQGLGIRVGAAGTGAHRDSAW